MRALRSVSIIDRVISAVLFFMATLLVVSLIATQANAQTAPKKYISLASTNSTLVLAGKVLLGTAIVTNQSAAIYYLKLYNKATAPICGTDVPLWTIAIPFGQANSGGGFVLPLGQGLIFPNGLGFCITSGLADNDTGSAAAGLLVNVGVSRQ